jgi:vanillate O-demethylase ferredoxin subunit
MASLPEDPQPFIETHILFCTNQRAEGHPRSCCADRGGHEFMAHLTKRVAEEGIDTVKITEAGCMERCELGPAMVVYPDAVWYSPASNDDAVERLVLDVDQRIPKPRPTQLLDLTVASIAQETADIKSFELAAKDGADLPAFDAGAHVDVITEGGLRRSYSIASDPTERNHYTLGVLREPNSRGGSAWMHGISQGDTISITPPENLFPLADGNGPHILIAGGIGITPMLAMARVLKARGAAFHLHYCTRSPEQTAFLDTAKSVAGNNLTLHHDGGDPSKGMDLAATLKDQLDGSHLYICGPGGLITAVRDAAAHWSDDSVHFELFAAAPSNADFKNEAFDIYLSRRRLDLTVPADRSILEVIRAEGIALDSSCEQGFCSTCQVRLISGEAEHRDQILSEEEKAKGDKILTCISRAKPGEKLVLDI